MSRQALRPEDTLSPRELVAARALAQNAAGDRELARSLGVSRAGLQFLLRGCRSKTGAENRTALALWFRSKYPDDAAFARAYIAACVRICGGMPAGVGRERKAAG